MRAYLYASAAMLVLALLATLYLDNTMASPPGAGGAYHGLPKASLLVEADSRLMHPAAPNNTVLAVVEALNPGPLYVRAWSYTYPPDMVSREDKRLQPMSEALNPGASRVTIIPVTGLYVDYGAVAAVLGAGKCAYIVDVEEQVGDVVARQRLVYTNCSGTRLIVKPIDTEAPVPNEPLGAYVAWAKDHLGPLYKVYTAVPRRDMAFLEARLRYILGESYDANASLSEVVGRALEFIARNTRYERTSFDLEAPAEDLVLTGKGDCFKASLALANLLRMLGVPARLATGYYVSSFIQVGDTYRANITQKNLHMWVEIPYGDGWIPLDPTPPRETPHRQGQGAGAPGAAGTTAPSGSTSPGPPPHNASHTGTSAGHAPIAETSTTTSAAEPAPQRAGRAPTPRMDGGPRAESSGDMRGGNTVRGYAVAAAVAAALLLLLEHARRGQEMLVEQEMLLGIDPLAELREAWEALRRHQRREALRRAYEAVVHSLRRHVPVAPSDTAREILLGKLGAVVGAGFPRRLVEVLERVFYGGRDAGEDEVVDWLREAERVAERLHHG